MAAKPRLLFGSAIFTAAPYANVSGDRDIKKAAVPAASCGALTRFVLAFAKASRPWEAPSVERNSGTRSLGKRLVSYGRCTIEGLPEEPHEMKKSATTKATTKSPAKATAKTASKNESPSRLIDARIKELGDWRGKMLAHVRALIRQALPGVIEEWKWRGVPVWYHDGMICTGETYKSVVKLTFAKGASLGDPKGLFNSSLDGNVRRAIDIHEGDELDEDAFKTLVRSAAAQNKPAKRAK